MPSRNQRAAGSFSRKDCGPSHSVEETDLRVWVKTDPKALNPAMSFARDVSKIGHWGVGEVELAVNNEARLRDAEAFVRESFGSETRN